MGLLSRIKNPLTGTAQVVGCEPAPTQLIKAPCRMQLVVQAPGIAPFSCEQVFEAPLSRWPAPGDALPVTFDRDHPERMRVEWDQILSSGERARQDADALAASMRADPAAAAAPAAPAVAGAPAAPPPPTATVITLGAGQTVQVIGGGDRAAAIARAEQKLGIDLDGDGLAAGAPGQAGGLSALIAQALGAAQGAGMAVAPAAAPAPPPAIDHTIAELEQLGALHDRGVLTDEEFAAQKQRILGGS
jgi:hypothetical protein